MTEPLIDRDLLADMLGKMWETTHTPASAADVVLTHLRDVLTPEALWPTEEYGGYNGHFLHRRIFGEAK